MMEIIVHWLIFAKNYVTILECPTLVLQQVRIIKQMRQEQALEIDMKADLWPIIFQKTKRAW